MKTISVAAAILLTGGVLTACSGDRWCERDAGDVKVAKRYCEAGTPGYEWEPDGGEKKKKTKKRKKAIVVVPTTPKSPAAVKSSARAPVKVPPIRRS